MSLSTLHSTKDFFRIWFTWKLQALYAFLVIVGLIMAFAYVYTPDYTSNAKILLLPRTSEGAIISTGKDEPKISPITNQDTNTEIELLTSDEVARETVKFFAQKGGGMGLKAPNDSWVDDAVDQIKKMLNETFIFIGLKQRLAPFEQNVKLLKSSLEIEPVANSSIILVTLNAERPKAASVVLNKLLETYVERHNRAFTKEEGVQFYEDQASSYYGRLKTAETQLKAYQKEWNIVSISRQNEKNIDMLVDLVDQLKNIELSYSDIQGRVNILRKALKDNSADVIITKEMRNIPSIVEIEKRLTPLLIDRSRIMSDYTQSSKQFSSIETQIKLLLDELRKETIKSVKADEMELSLMKARQKALQDLISKLQQQANELNSKEKNMNNLDREVQLLQNHYTLYASKAEDARINRERMKQDLANVTIAEKATFPIEPSFPNRVLMLYISIFVGVFAALGTPFVLEFLDHSFKIPEDVQHILSLPVICTFPETKGDMNLRS